MKTALTRIARAWLDPHYTPRQEAIATAAPEFCLSKPSFELALDWIFSLWTESKITEAIAQNPFKDKTYAAQVLACNTPAMIAQGFFQGAILNLPQCIKIPGKQPTFARLLHQSITELAPELAQLFELNTWQDDLPAFYAKLKQADLVFAYGRDETMATLKQQINDKALFIAHGHAESAAIIFKEATQEETLEKLAYDMLSYDQRGCLSPRLTLIEKGGALSPEACVALFAEKILPRLAALLPRGGLFAGEAAEILHQRSVYGFRGPLYCGEDWTLCYTQKPDWPQTALPRFMPFTPFKGQAELMSICLPQKDRLISLGYAGSTEKQALLSQELTPRIFPLGEMQKQLMVF